MAQRLRARVRYSLADDTGGRLAVVVAAEAGAGVRVGRARLVVEVASPVDTGAARGVGP